MGSSTGFDIRPIRSVSGEFQPTVYPHSTPRDLTRSEALRTLVFWAATLALSSQALSITGITFHIVDIGAAAGLPQKQTVALFLPIALFSTLVGYLIGVISDRAKLKAIYIGMMVFEAIGIMGMAHLDVPGLRLQDWALAEAVSAPFPL